MHGWFLGCTHTGLACNASASWDCTGMPHCTIADDWHHGSTVLGKGQSLRYPVMLAQLPCSDSHGSHAVYLVQSSLQVSHPCLTSV